MALNRYLWGSCIGCVVPGSAPPVALPSVVGSGWSEVAAMSRGGTHRALGEPGRNHLFIRTVSPIRAMANVWSTTFRMRKGSHKSHGGPPREFLNTGDCRPRPPLWIRQLVVRSTGSRWPQPIVQGMGPAEKLRGWPISGIAIPSAARHRSSSSPRARWLACGLWAAPGELAPSGFDRGVFDVDLAVLGTATSDRATRGKKRT